MERIEKGKEDGNRGKQALNNREKGIETRKRKPRGKRKASAGAFNFKNY
jgi:hypothetical protein